MNAELTTAQQLVLGFIEECSLNGQPPPTYREICSRFGYKSPKAAADHVMALERKGLLVRTKRSARGLRLTQQATGIPLLGRIPAGPPNSGKQNIEARLPVNPEVYGIRDRTHAFALRVFGDSMIGRRLFDGDIVILERDVEPKNGDVVAALIDNESTLKTLVRKVNKAWLQAENPKYPNIYPAVSLQIQGVARAVIRFFPR